MNIEDSFAERDSFGGAEKMSVVLECCTTTGRINNYGAVPGIDVITDLASV